MTCSGCAGARAHCIPMPTPGTGPARSSTAATRRKTNRGCGSGRRTFRRATGATRRVATVWTSRWSTRPMAGQAQPGDAPARLFDRTSSDRFPTSVLVVDAAGQITAPVSNTLTPSKQNLSDREHFHIHMQSASAGLFVSRPLVSRLQQPAPRGIQPSAVASRTGRLAASRSPAPCCKTIFRRC